MPRLIDRLRPPQDEERYSLNQYVADIAATFEGYGYLFGQGGAQGPPGVPSEPTPDGFEQTVRQVYYRNGVVAACMAARLYLFSEARFKFRRFSDRAVFGGQELAPLERPWPNGTSGDLLARFEQDASLAGNSYVIRIGNSLHHVRPDWMSIILGSDMASSYEVADAPDATVVGYAYWPHGKAGKYEPRVFLPGEVAHFAPEPDPLARFRGLSWISKVLREIDTHRQFTEHKAKFMEKGAPPFAIKYPPELTKGDQGDEKAKKVIELFREKQADAGRKWEALHLFGGGDPVTLGLNFRDLDFKAIQGATETQICAAARVPASVAGISEGLQGSALNAGNFGQARRQFGEQFAYPNWRIACEALAGLITVPTGAELWYDTTDVAFLHEDAKDAAEVISVQAQAIRQLTDGGYDPSSVVAAVKGEDLSLLKHTGLVPVQLQPPGTTLDDKPSPATTNGASAQPSTNGAN